MRRVAGPKDDSDWWSIISASLSISAASVSANGVELSPSPSVGLCVCLSVRKVYCDKTVDWNQVPFGMVSGVCRGMGVLDGHSDSRRGGGWFGVNLGRPIVTNENFVA